MYIQVTHSFYFADGRIFYYNRKTGHKQWENPFQEIVSAFISRTEVDELITNSVLQVTRRMERYVTRLHKRMDESELKSIEKIKSLERKIEELTAGGSSISNNNGKVNVNDIDDSNNNDGDIDEKNHKNATDNATTTTNVNTATEDSLPPPPPLNQENDDDNYNYDDIDHSNMISSYEEDIFVAASEIAGRTVDREMELLRHGLSATFGKGEVHLYTENTTNKKATNEFIVDKFIRYLLNQKLGKISDRNGSAFFISYYELMPVENRYRDSSSLEINKIACNAFAEALKKSGINAVAHIV